MRGIEREERSQVTDLLRQGIPPSTIVKELGIPMTTVCEWNKALKKSLPSKPIEKTDFINNAIKSAEIKISNAMSLIISPEVSDHDWFEVEKTISLELNKLTDKILCDLRG